jgi:hypothetical protein
VSARLSVDVVSTLFRTDELLKLSRELFSRVSAKKDRAYSTALNLVFLFTHMNAQQMKQEKNLVGWKIIGREKETSGSPHRSHSYELITRHPKFV